MQLGFFFQKKQGDGPFGERKKGCQSEWGYFDVEPKRREQNPKWMVKRMEYPERQS